MVRAASKRIAAPKHPVSKKALHPKSAPIDDPVHYLGVHKKGEDSLQRGILELLRPLTELWFRAQGKPTFVGAGQFIYWKQFQPTSFIAPDLYVLPGVSPSRRILRWKVWETHIRPTFALEMVFRNDWETGYRTALQGYEELGVRELIIFDPEPSRSVDRVRFQRYQKLPRQGFVRVETSNEDRISSQVLGCYLRLTGKGSYTRLRLATGPSGDELFPTEAEVERAAKEAGLARIDELLALLPGKTRKTKR